MLPPTLPYKETLCLDCFAYRISYKYLTQLQVDIYECPTSAKVVRKVTLSEMSFAHDGPGAVPNN